MAEVKVMAAAVYEEYGEIDVLKVKKDVPRPSVSGNQLLVAVKAAGVNPVDWKLRKGWIKAWPQSLPMIPGWDMSGEVVAVGPDAKGFAVGDDVYSYNRPAFDCKDEHPECETEAMGMNGCAAEYVSVSDWKTAKKPAKFSHAQAGSTPLAALTAYQGLFDYAKLTAGQTVLVLNASGGVGSWAVGLAKNAGATVIGVCSGKKADYVKGLGADTVVDYTLGDLVEQVKALDVVIDVVYDAIGGDSTTKSIEVLKDGGFITTIANGGAINDLPRDIKGISMLVKPNGAQLTTIAELIDAGKVPTPTVTEMPLADIQKSHEISEGGRVQGKLVLIM